MIKYALMSESSELTKVELAFRDVAFRVGIIFTPARDFLLEKPWRIIIPNPKLAKPNQLLSIIICLFKI
jgi:hypothetical protein